MLGHAETLIKMLLLIQAAFALPLEVKDEKSDAGVDITTAKIPDEAFDYYDSNLDREESSVSFDGNAEEALLKVLGEKDNTINVNIGELFDILIATQNLEKTSITPAVFFSTFLSSLTKESMIILLLTPIIFLFLTSISTIVAVPTLLFGLSLMSEGNIPALDRISPFENFESIPEPIALPNIDNIADIDYSNSDSSAPRFWQDSNN